MKFLKDSKGFTLAEMLIVMAVVVVLAAATMPAITGQTEAAKQSNDLAALSNAYTQAYAEAAMAKAGGVATPTAAAVDVTFSQTNGNFDKFPSATIGGYTVSGMTGATGAKKVTFTFNGDLTVTAITLTGGT